MIITHTAFLIINDMKFLHEEIEMKLLSLKTKLLLVITVVLYAIDSIIISIQIYYNARIITLAEVGDINALVLQIVKCCVLLFGEYILVALANAIRLLYLSNGVTDIKNNIMKNIMNLSIKNFKDEKIAYYFNLISTDVEMYRDDFMDSLPFLVNAISSLLSASYMLGKIHPSFIVMAILTSMLPTIIIKPFAEFMQKCKNNYSKTSEEYTKVLKENIEAYDTIRFNCCETRFEEKHKRANIIKQRKWMIYSLVGKMNFETLMSIAGFSSIACLGMGGYLVSKSIVEVGMLLAAVNYFSMISNQLSNISSYVVSIKSTKQIVEKIYEQTDLKPIEEKDISSHIDSNIEYSSVSFAFDEKQLYDKFSYRFEERKCYAIVGESGSGKSTLVKLILKCYDKYEGIISLGGKDIRKMSERQIYQCIGIVEQRPYIFNESLYENITLHSGRPKKNSEEFQELLRKVNLEELARRVGETPLGDFGDNISGGERQRINIARVLNRKPSVIIFDEPITGLDPENRRLINEFIFQYKDVTRIVITHNWSQEYLEQFDGVIKLGNFDAGRLLNE